jgi:CheY-like chemotaxis protein
MGRAAAIIDELPFPPAQLRLIALSGYPGPDIRDACLAAGFDAYLAKPGDSRELERLLGEADADSSKRVIRWLAAFHVGRSADTPRPSES